MRKLKMYFRLVKETKSCYRFETGQGADWTALYLKKRAIEAAGIDPYKGVTITVAERRDGDEEDD